MTKTDEEYDEIQEQLAEIVKPMEGDEAELMALHFGFSTSHTMALYLHLTEQQFRDRIITCIDKYLEGNPYQGNASRRTQ